MEKVAGLFRKGRKHGYQAAIPADVREAFGGRKKYQRIFETENEDVASRLAVEAAREFKAHVAQLRSAKLDGDQIDPKRVQRVIGFLLGRFLIHRREHPYDLEEACGAVL